MSDREKPVGVHAVINPVGLETERYQGLGEALAEAMQLAEACERRQVADVRFGGSLGRWISASDVTPGGSGT